MKVQVYQSIGPSPLAQTARSGSDYLGPLKERRDRGEMQRLRTGQTPRKVPLQTLAFLIAKAELRDVYFSSGK